MAPLYPGKIGEFIHFPAGLHAEAADSLERHIVSQHADIEDAGLFDELPGVVALLDRNGQPGRVAANLEAGIGNATIIRQIPGGEHVQAVA